jgi:hypothetical protein
MKQIINRNGLPARRRIIARLHRIAKCVQNQASPGIYLGLILAISIIFAACHEQRSKQNLTAVAADTWQSQSTLIRHGIRKHDGGTERLMSFDTTHADSIPLHFTPSLAMPGPLSLKDTRRSALFADSLRYPALFRRNYQPIWQGPFFKPIGPADSVGRELPGKTEKAIRRS